MEKSRLNTILSYVGLAILAAGGAIISQYRMETGIKKEVQEQIKISTDIKK